MRPQARPADAAGARPFARPDEVAAAPEEVRPLARPDGLGQVPSEVAEGATIEGALPMRQTSLIGLFSGPDGRTALLRLGTGDVVRAAQGDVVGGAVVTAIAEDALRLWQDGEERVLTMPA
jgi:hypothetical protein